MRVDPLIQQGAKLTAGKEASGITDFGYSMALSADGNTAIIGGTFDTEGVGAVWVFTRSEGKWTQQGAKLTAKDESGTGWFGYSVALSSDGNTALIGGYEDTKFVGAAWVFTRSEGKWTQQGAKLTGGKEESGNGLFGDSVALSSDGNTALIGAKQDSKINGAAWVFTRSEDKWTQQGAKLIAKDESGEGSFGHSVALSSDGNTALIGGWSDNGIAGAAWVFTRAEGKWAQQGAKLAGGKEESAGGDFGESVALSADGNTALIGAPGDSEVRGAVWVFTRSERQMDPAGRQAHGRRGERQRRLRRRREAVR